MSTLRIATIAVLFSVIGISTVNAGDCSKKEEAPAVAIGVPVASSYTTQGPSIATQVGAIVTPIYDVVTPVTTVTNVPVVTKSYTVTNVPVVSELSTVTNVPVATIKNVVTQTIGSAVATGVVPSQYMPK